MSSITVTTDGPNDEQDDLPYTIQEISKTHKIINVYISEEISDPSNYVDLIGKLRSASQFDTFYIHLNTPGGYVDTGVQIMNAMRNSAARIITVLDGTVCSMGALIFVSAQEFIVNDNCRLMFHNYSGGTYGKGHEQVAQLDSTTKWFKDIMGDICVPFLSVRECDDIKNGMDLWLDSDQVRERMAIMVKEDERIRKVDERKTKVKPKAKVKPKTKAKSKKKVKLVE